MSDGWDSSSVNHIFSAGDIETDRTPERPQVLQLLRVDRSSMRIPQVNPSVLRAVSGRFRIFCQPLDKPFSWKSMGLFQRIMLNCAGVEYSLTGLGDHASSYCGVGKMGDEHQEHYVG